MDLSNSTRAEEKKKILLHREQYYLDNINPSLNICKIANSPLGVKRNKIFSTNLSVSRKGRKHKSYIRFSIIPKIITNKTRVLLSERVRGVRVKVFDQSNNLISQFPNMKAAANYLSVNPSTISNIFKTGKSYDNLIYKFEVKDIKIRVYNSNKKLVNILDNLKKASLFYNVPSTTMYRYIKSGKIYKDKYYFVSGKDY